MNSTVYPIGILVMGKELTLVDAKATLAKVQGTEPWGPPIHRVNPYCYNLMRFANADVLTPFFLTRTSIIYVSSIHAFGPALIERIVFGGTDVLYDKLATSEAEGKLFVCPHKILQSTHQLEVYVRCIPELFMLEGKHVEQPETLTSHQLDLLKSHDSSECDDCEVFRLQTGLDP